ncbi:serine hydroxymethyltransferase, partial [Patescibacteria group bacterium]|nr:serine hydroxymethyltransferase [Patescibacteria group bacterium]
GLRIGTPALTTREFDENDMREIGEMISHVVNNSTNTDILDGVRDKIKKMTKAHPLYEGWSYESPE